jgi:hypothetical protein
MSRGRGSATRYRWAHFGEELRKLRARGCGKVGNGLAKLGKALGVFGSFDPSLEIVVFEIIVGNGLGENILYAFAKFG